MRIDERAMKKSLVLEIQKMATESHHDITDLLRKALLAATKLKLDEFRNWINKELGGYRDGDVPIYRKARAKIYLKNPYHGLIPVYFPTEEIADAFCEVEIRDPIGNIVSVLAGRDDSKTGPIYPLTPNQERFLLSQQNGGLNLPPIRAVTYNALETVIDSVRTQILEWSLRLEDKGILGEGMTFSSEEKKIAIGNQEINIKNFQGILGNVENSSVSQQLEMNIQKDNFESLKRYLFSIGLEEKDVNELKNAISKDTPPKTKDGFGEKVSSWIGKMISKAASGSWQVGVGAAGGLLAKAICLYYGI